MVRIDSTIYIILTLKRIITRAITTIMSVATATPILSKKVNPGQNLNFNRMILGRTETFVIIPILRLQPSFRFLKKCQIFFISDPPDLTSPVASLPFLVHLRPLYVPLAGSVFQISRILPDEAKFSLNFWTNM